MNKQHNLDYGLIWLSIIAISAGLLIAWGLYALPIDYPFRPLFLFATAPAILLVFVNIHVAPKDNPDEFWACVYNMLVLLLGANTPILGENFLDTSITGGGYLSDALYEVVTKVFHYGLIAVGTGWAVAFNILNIMPGEKQNVQ